MERNANNGHEVPNAGYIVAAVTVGAGAGWMLAGPFAAVAGGVVFATVATIVVGARRMRQVGQALDGQAIDLSALTTKQALAALSGATGGAASFDSPQMKALEEIAKTAETDPHAALTEAERARDRFPRSPLIIAEVSRRCAALGRTDAARETAVLAIRLALDGGTNPMAAKLFGEFEAHRDALDLTSSQLQRLAGAVQAAGDDDGAAWCRERARS